MSCLLDLYDTYEANKDFVGQIEHKHNGQAFTLLPVSHTTQTAHIEVYITEDGTFQNANVIVNKSERDTVIPCTEDSANRAGAAIAPYPLHDKLSYVAGDFVTYGGKVKSDDKGTPFQHYIQKLKEWAESPFSLPQINSIYTYLRKGNLIKDLVNQKVLWLDEQGKLIDKWNEKYKPLCGGIKPDIFTTVTAGQEGAFIRFTVYSKEKIIPKVWQDERVYESFIHFYQNLLGAKDLCFVTGKLLPVTDKHANKIRNSGDKAKLISANDNSGFTFRGRFNKSSEAASISYDVSQKAHNALKWLIRRQAQIIDNRVFLVWSVDNGSLPNPQDDIYDLSQLLGKNEVDNREAYTNAEFADQFGKALWGYSNKLAGHNDVNILILDSATTGRLAILYYRNLQQDIYFQRLAAWHSQCVWRHTYLGGKEGSPYFGAPAMRDIAQSAYGSHASDKIIKGTMERMLPCVVDGRHIPKDILHSVFHRTSNPLAFDQGWEWNKSLSIACALINRQEFERRKRGFTVALDEQQNDRNYLFGRLLAIADVLEHRALQSEDWRTSNAMRYMNEFSEHPERTWKTIQTSLVPYQSKLGRNGSYLTQLIDNVAAKIEFKDFDDRPLNGKFLLGFYSQRHKLYQKKSEQNPVAD